jgi:adenosylcobinamide-GDP ribazoletransferase
VTARDDLRAAISFLTPLGAGARTPSPTTMVWFPVVGAGMGWALGRAWRTGSRWWPPLPAAALVVAADVALTGALHLDGLADTADGLLAHVPARARLDIMAEPQVGTFAAVAVGVALVSRAAALSAMPPSPALLAATYCSSRSIMVLASRALPYARGEGLATSFMPTQPGADLAVGAGVAGLAGALGLAWLVGGRRGAAAVVSGWAASSAVLAAAHRRLGGFTGDVLGGAGVVAETATLIVAARVPAGRLGRAR